MKKHNKIISLLLVFISFILILTGCGKEVLAKPTNLKINYTTATLSWDMVNDASEYIIDCGTKKLKSSKASFDLSILELEF